MEDNHWNFQAFYTHTEARKSWAFNHSKFLPQSVSHEGREIRVLQHQIKITQAEIPFKSVMFGQWNVCGYATTPQTARMTDHAAVYHMLQPLARTG
jgi:hypothetical protein